MPDDQNVQFYFLDTLPPGNGLQGNSGLIAGRKNKKNICMIQKDKTYNLATFFCLYIAQTIPMSFFSTVIPVMMRQENFSLSAIGFSS